MTYKVLFTSDSTFAQQCYDQLQYEIIEGILKPGEKLKVDPIKTRFSIGQSPVREALSRLVACGLVDTEDNKGFRVAAISEENIRDIYKTFTHIENMALALAIEKGDDTWEANIIAALYKLGLIENKDAFESYALWVERNYNFHVALIAGCESPTLLEIRRSVYIKFDRYCRMAYHLTKEELTINHEDHKKLATAVLERDVKKSQALMTYHINGALEEVIKKFKKNTLFENLP
jgi:GntR family transcriptional regulator, carbon starvation induced regulator